jgi:hypothetical protein
MLPAVLPGHSWPLSEGDAGLPGLPCQQLLLQRL